MRYLKITALMTACLAFAAMPATAQDTVATLAQEQRVTMIDNDGDPVGTVDIVYGPNGLLVTLDGRNLPPGGSAFHIHEHGDCSDHDAFMESGGHAHHDGERHGFLDEGGPHFGDFPNIWVHEDGTVRAQFYNNRATFDDLHGPTGSAFMIHAGQDDHLSQPAGDAGDRIACGVIAAPRDGHIHNADD